MLGCAMEMQIEILRGIWMVLLPATGPVCHLPWVRQFHCRYVSTLTTYKSCLS